MLSATINLHKACCKFKQIEKLFVTAEYGIAEFNVRLDTVYVRYGRERC